MRDQRPQGLSFFIKDYYKFSLLFDPWEKIPQKSPWIPVLPQDTVTSSDSISFELNVTAASAGILSASGLESMDIKKMSEKNQSFSYYIVVKGCLLV